MVQKYVLRLKVFFCLMFFCWHSGVFSLPLSPANGLAYYAGVKNTDFFQGSEYTKPLTEIVKNYTKDFGVDFFRISEGKDVVFGVFDSGENYLVIYLNGNMPHFSGENLKKDALQIDGKEYAMWYDLGKGFILMGGGRLIVSNDFGNFLSQVGSFDKNWNLEPPEKGEYEYFTYENIVGEFYGKEYYRRSLFKTRDEKRTYYYLKKKETLKEEIDLSGYIPKRAKVESMAGYELLKKVLFGGLAGLEVEPEFLKTKLQELKPVASYWVSFDGGTYLLVYTKGVAMLKEVLKELYSSLFFYRNLEISSKDGYSFVELPIIGVKKYFLKLEDNIFALTDSADLAFAIKNGKYENPKYKKVDLSSLNFGNELVRFYKNKIEVVER